jgi:isoleucyl-tRNA synthetase
LYQKLTGGESVHLCYWPTTDTVNQLVLTEMQHTREAITNGLSQRAEAGIKVRQPLATATLYNAFDAGQPRETYRAYLDIIAEELNVKQVKLAALSEQAPTDSSAVAITLDMELTTELKREGLMREIVRHVQQARKQAGLEVDDRIDLALKSADEEITTVLKNPELTEVVKQETLTQQLNETMDHEFSATVKLEGKELEISLSRAK